MLRLIHSLSLALLLPAVPQATFIYSYVGNNFTTILDATPPRVNQFLRKSRHSIPPMSGRRGRGSTTAARGSVSFVVLRVGLRNQCANGVNSVRSQR